MAASSENTVAVDEEIEETPEELAARLDREIDEYIDNLPIRKYEHGFSEDNWEEEMEQIPIFMTKSPDEIDAEKSPALAALQSLKYEFETPEGKALDFKEEGNEYFKKKEYKKAIISYTEGIKETSSIKAELAAILYTNRAAANFYLGNYRSSLADARAGVKVKPDHLKALVKAAECCCKLNRYEEAIVWCDAGLKLSPTDKKLLDLRVIADKEKRAKDKEQRKKKADEKRKKAEHDKLLAIIKERGVQLNLGPPASGGDADATSPLLKTQNPDNAVVHLDSEGVLHWPTMFLYPECGQSDFVAAFNENNCFLDVLETMFASGEPVPWDADRKYLPSNMEIYFEEFQKQKLHQFSPDTTLKSALTDKRYVVSEGTPVFLILIKGSEFKNKFLQKYSSKS